MTGLNHIPFNLNAYHSLDCLQICCPYTLVLAEMSGYSIFLILYNGRVQSRANNNRSLFVT